MSDVKPRLDEAPALALRLARGGTLSSGLRVYRGSEFYPSDAPGLVVTVGNFDGVHRGHRALIDRAVSLADETGAPCCIYTFHPAPRDVLRPNNGIPRIQTLDDRLASLEKAGVEVAIVEPFTVEFGSRGARWFVEEVLSHRLRARAVVLGYDFRFGKGREGGFDEVSEWLDVPVERCEAEQELGAAISSSRIREAIQLGQLDLANRLLGRPHEVVGPVIHGDARGRTLGFPTANVSPETELVPADGVYAVRAEVDGALWPGVANVGNRPTFGPGRTGVEVHLLEYSGDLYGTQLRVRFEQRLRGERRFESADALVEQIALDISAARAALGSE